MLKTILLSLAVVVPISYTRKLVNQLMRYRTAIDPIDREIKSLQRMIDLSEKQGYYYPITVSSQSQSESYNESYTRRRTEVTTT